jgi:hypothetical protein
MPTRSKAGIGEVIGLLVSLAASTLWAAIVLRIERNQAALLTEIFHPTHPHAHDGTRDGWLRSGEVDNFHPPWRAFKCLLTRAFATLYTSKVGSKVTMSMRLVRRQRNFCHQPQARGVKSCQVDLETPY